MSSSAIRVLEWVCRSLAVAALFVTFRPATAAADVVASASGSASSYKSGDQHAVSSAVVEVDVDNEDEDLPNPE